MARYSEAHKRATQKYQKKAYYKVSTVFPKEWELLLKERAKDCGGSVGAYIKALVAQDIGGDDYEEPERETFYDAP